MVAVSFTVLVLNELCMVSFEITTWHPIMIISLVGTLVIYMGSIPFLGGYFDLPFMLTLWVSHRPNSGDHANEIQGVCMARGSNWSYLADPTICREADSKNN
jgi:hypothetical protein